MKKETRYRYEKRIKELEETNQDLYRYRNVAITVYDHLIKEPLDGKPNVCWLLAQYKVLFK